MQRAMLLLLLVLPHAVRPAGVDCRETATVLLLREPACRALARTCGFKWVDAGGACEEEGGACLREGSCAHACPRACLADWECKWTGDGGCVNKRPWEMGATQQRILAAATSSKPTRRPSRRPTRTPSRFPSKRPTVRPTRTPSRFPSKRPTVRPSKLPTRRPTPPSRKPTLAPTSSFPSASPTAVPTSSSPTASPTSGAPTTMSPSASPTTTAPTTLFPSASPTTAGPTTLSPSPSPTTHVPTEFPTTMTPTTLAPSRAWSQQGTKLLGANRAGPASFVGDAVALSADGNTAIVGGDADNNFRGAVWIFVRSGSTWSQQGGKRVGSGAVGFANQGYSVSLSGNGNIAVAGGPNDNNGVGATWVFVRTGMTTWSQQGAKLVGTGRVGASGQGQSVGISADGSTIIVGGYGDNNRIGAAWIFAWSVGGNKWVQQGPKLVGSGYVGWAPPYQGNSVSISADGDTAIVGGYYDDNDVGATWIFVRSGANTWSQQGPKLVGTGHVGAHTYEGWAVAISGDGNTAAVGGYFDNEGIGATWVFVRFPNGSWSQQGGKLVGNGFTGSNIRQGSCVSISHDGNVILVGGPFDAGGFGAVWTFHRVSGESWSQQSNAKLVGTGRVGLGNLGTAVAISGDGNTALVGGPQDNSGIGAVWVFVFE